MSFFNTAEPTATVRMTGYMSYGPTDDQSPTHVLENGQVYDVPRAEADWLVSAGLAEGV